MSTITAQLLIGKAHPYEGGIIPEYTMYLSENGVSRWTLLESNISPQSESSNSFIAQWLPTLEYMLEDAIIMLGIYILKDEELIRMAKQYIGEQIENESSIGIYGDASEKGLEILRNRARQMEHDFKITISVFYGSSIVKQISVLQEYKLDVEVCMPVYAKEYRVLGGRMVVKGTLNSEEQY